MVFQNKNSGTDILINASSPTGLVSNFHIFHVVLSALCAVSEGTVGIRFKLKFSLSCHNLHYLRTSPKH